MYLIWYYKLIIENGTYVYNIYMKSMLRMRNDVSVMQRVDLTLLVGTIELNYKDVAAEIIVCNMLWNFLNLLLILMDKKYIDEKKITISKKIIKEHN